MSSLLEYQIHRFESVESTNLKARSLVEGPQSLGLAVIARTQDQGRGSKSRSWHSPYGGLYVSIVLKQQPGRPITDLTILAGVALNQTVNTLMPKQCETTIKWPNDCLLNMKKVGGILCEALSEDDLAVVGIGLNINTPKIELAAFEENSFSATSMAESAQGQGMFDMAETEKTLLNKLRFLYQMYMDEGFLRLQSLWESNCYFVGKKIEFSDQGQPKGQGIQGTLLGIDEKGGLVLSTEGGDRRAFYSGEITCFWP